MAVYMIRAGENGPVKIGRSADRNLRDRMHVIQSGNHVRLSVIRVFEGGAGVERALHSLFSDGRMHGEWFKFDPAMLGDVGFCNWEAAEELLKGWNDIPSHAEKGAAISKWMRRSWLDPVVRGNRIDRTRATRERKRLAKMAQTQPDVAA